MTSKAKRMARHLQRSCAKRKIPRKLQKTRPNAFIKNFSKTKKRNLVALIGKMVGERSCVLVKRARYDGYDCVIDKIFQNLEIVQFIAIALKSILKFVEMQSLGAKCCKMCKI